MKKIFVMAFAVLISAGTAMAQLPINKGNFFVSANISELDLTFGGGTDFTLGAGGGYFLADKLALIGGLSISADSQKIGGETYSDNSFGLAAGARYFFLEQTKGGFFADGMLGVNKQKDVDAAFRLALGAGYAYFLNEHVALEPMVMLTLPFSSDYDVTFSIGGAISVYF